MINSNLNSNSNHLLFSSIWETKLFISPDDPDLPGAAVQLLYVAEEVEPVHRHEEDEQVRGGAQSDDKGAEVA